MRYALIGALALAGCAVPTAEEIWIRPGLSAFEADRTVAACAGNARVQFPERRALETVRSAGIGIGVGNRGVRGGVGGGITVFEVDRNEARRDASFYACMRQAGFTLVTLPGCGSGPATPLESQPFDVRGLCVANGRLAAP
ncbi:MAG: hypothetical protein AAGF30_10625 [Pseudomonadota bacterium]